MDELIFATSGADVMPWTSGLDSVSQVLERGDRLWIDLSAAPSARQTDSLASLLHCPALLISSALRTGTVPKLDTSPGHIFLRLRMTPEVAQSAAAAHRSAGHLVAFLTKNLLVTIHDRAIPGALGPNGDADAEQDPSALLAEGTDLLLHEIASRVTDPYFPAFDAWRRRLDHVENAMLTRKRRLDFNLVVAVRHDLLLLSHGLELQREAIARLGHGGLEAVGEQATRRFSLLAEEALHLATLASGGRELVQNLFDLYVSISSQRTNLVMQRLTVVTTVFLPLTLITGIYGMNFDRMPELHFPWAYPAALAFMAAVGFALYWWFRRTGWFGDE